MSMNWKQLEEYANRVSGNTGELDLESKVDMRKFQVESTLFFMRVEVEKVRQMTDIAAILSTLVSVLDAIRRLPHD